VDVYDRNKWSRSEVAAGEYELPDEAESKLVPILNRVLELGRGPADLVGWVRDRLAATGRPGEAPRLVARRLAHELALVLRRRGVAETLVVDVRDTIRLPVAASRASGPKGRESFGAAPISRGGSVPTRPARDEGDDQRHPLATRLPPDRRYG
jgi:hypothetical protein